jgi:hypothetical protein
MSSYGKAGTNSRPEPPAFSFRPRHPGESPAEHSMLMARARKKFERAGRAKAIKGLMGENVRTIDSGDEATKER